MKKIGFCAAGIILALIVVSMLKRPPVGPTNSGSETETEQKIQAWQRWSQREAAELHKLLYAQDPNRPNRGLGANFDPSWVIKVVNTLQPLGKDKALAAVQEFCRVAPRRFEASDDLIFVLSILFDVPDDLDHSPPSARMTVPKAPKDPKRIPRFPIVIIEDVPLKVVCSEVYAGPTPSVILAAKYFREHAHIRADRLQPTRNPLQIYADFVKTYGWLYPKPGLLSGLLYSPPSEYEAGMSNIKGQLRKILRTVYRGDIEHGSLPRPVRWDMKRNMYTFLAAKPSSSHSNP